LQRWQAADADQGHDYRQLERSVRSLGQRPDIDSILPMPWRYGPQGNNRFHSACRSSPGRQVPSVHVSVHVCSRRGGSVMPQPGLPPPLFLSPGIGSILNIVSPGMQLR
jgi:hypothetical protein